MGAPDSPMPHRTCPVHCSLRRHITQSLGFGAKSTVGALSPCGTGQSCATSDTVRCAFDSAALTLHALFFTVTVSGFCSRPLEWVAVALLAHRTVQWHTGQSSGTPDSPVAHRTVWWIIVERGSVFREWLVHLRKEMVHRTLSGGTPDSPVCRSTAHSSPFCSFWIGSLTWIFIDLCWTLCTCRTCILEQTS
jgi:hypothetical protein